MIEGIKIPSYTIGSQIGRGGNGEVHIALPDNKNLLPIAVKTNFVNPQTIIAEYQLLERLRHQYIEQARTYGELPNRVPYFTMDYAEGGSLEDHLPPHTIVDPHAVASITYSTALALQHAHKTGVVHLDPKPSNLLLHRYPYPGSTDWEVRLGDWGSAREIPSGKESIPINGKTIGTKEYMAPEVLNEGLISRRSDVYSVGIILFQLLTGQLPFHGDIQKLLYVHHNNVPLPEMKTLRGGREGTYLENSLEQVARDATHRDRFRRLSAEEMVGVLDEIGRKNKEQEARNASFFSQATLTLRRSESLSPTPRASDITYKEATAQKSTLRLQSHQVESAITSSEEVIALSSQPKQLRPAERYWASLQDIHQKVFLQLANIASTPQIRIQKEGEQVILDIFGTNQRHILPVGETRLGSHARRDEYNKIIIPGNPYINYDHVSLFNTGDVILIQDLYSQCGTKAFFLHQ